MCSDIGSRGLAPFALIWRSISRPDLWNAVSQGNFPERELGLQPFDEESARQFDFDVLDATRIVPEEILPLRVAGKLVLDRNADNFFAETEQLLFASEMSFLESTLQTTLCFNDALCLTRTHLIRRGEPNFQQIPVSAPRSPRMHMQRDGHMQIRLYALLPPFSVRFESVALVRRSISLARASPSTLPSHPASDGKKPGSGSKR